VRDQRRYRLRTTGTISQPAIGRNSPCLDLYLPVFTFAALAAVRHDIVPLICLFPESSPLVLGFKDDSTNSFLCTLSPFVSCPSLCLLAAAPRHTNDLGATASVPRAW
jgi:hypothetical protein